jgi:hypothetical protein
VKAESDYRLPGVLNLIVRLGTLTVAAVVITSSAINAQEPPAPSPTTPQQEQAQRRLVTAGGTCLAPPPMVRWQDYNGPFSRLSGILAAKLDRPSVHLPNYKPGSVLCALGVKDKFVLFVRDTVTPLTLLNVAFNSAVDHAENSGHTFGHGMAGYGRREGANEESDASGRFFTDFLFPVVLHEDPRYYRLGRGGAGLRLLHAFKHAFVAHSDSGARMPNISEWAGTTAGVLLSDVYHPGTTHGAGSIARQVSLSVLQDTGSDMLREFWPEIARKLHVPFRDASAPIVRPVR